MKVKIKPPISLTVFFVLVFSFAAILAIDFPFSNRFFPLSISLTALLLCLIQLFFELRDGSKNAKKDFDDYVDIASDFSLSSAVVRARALRFLSWYIFLLLSIWIIGFKIAVPLFFISFLRFEGKVRWRVNIILTAISVYAIFFHFENLLGVRWPKPILENWFKIPWIF
jgi:hypothetical protein